MPRIAGIALSSIHGDLDATLNALVAAHGAPGPLAGDLLPIVLRCAQKALAGQRPDLVLVATTKGDVDRWCDSLLARPGDYTGGPAWLADELGRALGSPAFAVSSACASGPLAAGVAGRWILAGRARRVLVIGADRIGRFVSDGFASLNAIDPLACRPFDAERIGLRLGELVAAVLLDAANGEANGRFLQGWGASMDANHLTGPTRDGSGLALACRRALARAQSKDPALVIAHGTGTRYNDDSESLAYAAVCPATPVTAFKGLLGHSLGACGIAELALASIIHARRQTPGTVGLTRQGSAGSIRVLPPGPHAIAAGPILGANAGFGGLNGAVVVGDRPAPVRPRGGIRLASRIELGPQGWSRGRSGATIETIAWPEPGEGERLPKLSAKEILGRIDATWGRMDLACRALVTLGHLLAPLPENCAVVLVSSSGCAATDRAYEIQRRATGADPQRFPYTLPTTAIGEASIRLKLRGPGLSLHGADDAQARAVVEDLLGDGAEGVLFARIETDGDRHLAQAELWLSA